jgi:caspase domain-containing protein
MGRRAAVVIGVDRPKQLTPLQSAADGAARVEAWLKGEGFDVICLTDKAAPVQADDVKKAIKTYVTNPPRYSMLVVYFSGHGYWSKLGDVWLLSQAPEDTGEAINVGGAMLLAGYSGIPNVVFISDACRSAADTRSGILVEGVAAFPNYGDIEQPSKVDCFRATTASLPAYEGQISGSPQSVLTAAWMAAYQDPEPSMVRSLDVGNTKIWVVPNRRLEEYLQRKVDDLLAAIDPNLSQRIEASVPSSDEIYIARAQRVPQLAAPLPPARAAPAPPAADTSGWGSSAPPPLSRGFGSITPIPPATIIMPVPPARSVMRGPSTPRAAPPDPGRDAAAAIQRSLSNRPFAGGAGDELLPTNPGTEDKVRERLPDRDCDHFETEAGFVIRGVRVLDAVTARGAAATAQLLEPGGGHTPAVVQLADGSGQRLSSPTSVALALDGGRCVILPGLPGYIAHATVSAAGLSAVSYVPSSNTWRWPYYFAHRDDIDRLRATVTLAVEFNRFQVDSNREANALAQRIRMEKSIDPTLGLYAAVAYSQAGHNVELASVLALMRADLGADLFDVRLLATRLPKERPAHVPLVPFCPLLTQTWNLLRPRGFVLPVALQAARTFLCDSLWTTFEPPATQAILDAMHKGELQ